MTDGSFDLKTLGAFTDQESSVFLIHRCWLEWDEDQAPWLSRGNCSPDHPFPHRFFTPVQEEDLAPEPGTFAYEHVSFWKIGCVTGAGSFFLGAVK